MLPSPQAAWRWRQLTIPSELVLQVLFARVPVEELLCNPVEGAASSRVPVVSVFLVGELSPARDVTQKSPHLKPNQRCCGRSRSKDLARWRLPGGSSRALPVLPHCVAVAYPARFSLVLHILAPGCAPTSASTSPRRSNKWRHGGRCTLAHLLRPSNSAPRDSLCSSLRSSREPLPFSRAPCRARRATRVQRRRQ